MMVCLIANEWFKIQKQINIAVSVYTATWECNLFFLNKPLNFYTLLYEKMYNMYIMYVPCNWFSNICLTMFNWIESCEVLKMCMCMYFNSIWSCYTYMYLATVWLQTLYIWKDKQFGAQFHPDVTLGHTYTINNK